MGWISTGRYPVTSHPQVLAMLRQAVAAAADDARRWRALARALFDAGHYREAVDAWEGLLAVGGDPGDQWPSMAAAILDTAGPAAALDLCARRWPGAGTFAWHHARALALGRGGRIEEADVEFRRAMALGDPRHDALRALLRMHAGRGDGAALLAACDALPPATRHSAPALGYRALALSLLGRADEANALVDLDAGTMRFRFEPPGGVEAFNAALADAVLADQPRGSERYDILFNYDLRLPETAGLTALQAFIQTSYARYIEQLGGEHATCFMPPLPDATTTSHGAVTVRREGRNGQHIHTEALLTSVYHVRMPPVANQGAGALALGVCDEIVPGHRACWGERVLPALPGTLTIFPAHYFHDVRPTGVEEPRVVVVSDLMAAPA